MYLCFLPFSFAQNIQERLINMSLLEIDGLTHSFGENVAIQKMQALHSTRGNILVLSDRTEPAKAL